MKSVERLSRLLVSRLCCLFPGQRSAPGSLFRRTKFINNGSRPTLPRVSRPEFVVFKPFRVFAIRVALPVPYNRLVESSPLASLIPRGRLEDRDAIRPISDLQVSAFLHASTGTRPEAASCHETFIVYPLTRLETYWYRFRYSFLSNSRVTKS